MSALNWHRNANDAIIGDKIVIIARDIRKDKKPVPDTGRHKAQRAFAYENARAWIDVEIVPTGQFKLED